MTIALWSLAAWGAVSIVCAAAWIGLHWWVRRAARRSEIRLECRHIIERSRAA